MLVCRTVASLRVARASLEGRVAFVPTMGALHAGHLSLVGLARRDADATVASIFVNPTQFNDPGDLAAYPRTLEADLQLLEEAGVAVVFVPDAETIYPPGEQAVVVDVPHLTAVLEGEHRPGHFAGVCRVVLKLFNLVQPDVAVFGMKDFQQLRVIEAMTRGLNLPVEIVRGPTLRDPDGLAMSSRNRRLSDEARAAALAIPAALRAARAGVAESGDVVQEVARLRLMLERAQALTIEYAVAVSPVDLRQTDAVPVLFAVAARVDGVRLIDNVLVVDDHAAASSVAAKIPQ